MSKAPADPVRCPHFGECGGCQSQDIAYAEQLRLKQAALGDLFAGSWTGPIPITPSPQVWHYRNKVDPNFAPMRYDEPPPKGFQRDSVLGFKKKGRWYWPLDIQECYIGPEGLGALLDAARRWARSRAYSAFDSRTGEGFLRTLLVREGKRSGERMVVLLTRSGELDRDGFVAAVNEVFPATSIQHGINERKADVTEAEAIEVISGNECITEVLEIPDPAGVRRLSFRISPFSFFQTNALATELLYGAIRAQVAKLKPSLLLDLYGGSGGIALSCADLVEQVYSVEVVASATEDGQFNAARNAVDNIAFVTEKVEKYLRFTPELETLPPNSMVIMDPSRAGLHPKALRRLLELCPAHLLYVSCNPKIFAQELALFSTKYRLDSLEAFDLFPHTRHVELLASLSLC